MISESMSMFGARGDWTGAQNAVTETVSYASISVCINVYLH